MALPGDLNSVIVTGKYLDASGQALAGTVTFTPSVTVTDRTGAVVIPAAPRQYQLAGGHFTTDALAATDNAGLLPSGWTYQVVVAIQNLRPLTFSVPVPHTVSPVDITALAAASTIAASYPYDLAPAPSESIIYVSAAARASDSNTGLSRGQPKATIAGALAALGSSPGIVDVGVGGWVISGPDASGNAVTLANAGTWLRGSGSPNTTIVITGTVGWGIKAAAAQCTVSGLLVEIAATGSCTYGTGVDTPGSAGSAENVTFSDVLLDNVSGGAMGSGFCVAPSHAGSGAVDVAGTVFDRCHVAGAAAGAGFLVGNGAAANILNTHMYGCEAVLCEYGVRLFSGDVTWHGGQFGENTAADIRIESANSAPIVFDGFRSESGCRIVSASAVATPAAVTISNAVWETDSAHASPAGDIVSYALCGTLTLDSVLALITTSGSPVTPVFVVGNGGGQLSVALRGLSISGPLATLVSATAAGNVSVVAENFVPLTAAGGFAGPAIPGPVQLGPGPVITNYNGTFRDSFSPSSPGGAFSPLHWGAAGNGTTDDTTPVLAAAAAAIAAGGALDLGNRTFLTSGPIPAANYLHVRGAGYLGGAITNSASAMFTVAGSVNDVIFENVTLHGSGGHLFDATSGPSCSFWRWYGVQMVQGAAGYGIWNQVGGGLLDAVLDGACYLRSGTSATVAPWSITAAEGTVNSLRFRNSRLDANGSSAVPFFLCDPGSVAGWNEEILFDQITFEGCAGGCVWMTACTDVEIRQCSHWDATAVSDVYHFATSAAGYQSRTIAVRGGRSGNVTGSAHHFFADSGSVSIILDSFGSWASPPVISSPAAQTTIINPTAAGPPDLVAPGLVVSPGGLAATAADGFLRAPAVTGTPTGTPSAMGTSIPMAVDPVAGKIWAYVNGAWKSSALS